MKKISLTKPVIFILCVTAFILSTIIISSISLRLDLSKGKAYTLSPATNRIITKLDDLVTITLISSSDLPSRLIPLRTDVTDMLQEFQKNSNGKVAIQIRDPKKDSTALSEVQQLGIPEIQLSQIQRDTFAVSSVYFAIVIRYGDKKEVIPQAIDSSNLEYNLVSAIYKLTQKNTPIIGIIEEPALGSTSQISLMKQVFEQQYEVQSISLSDKENGLSKTKIVILIDDGVTQYSKDRLDQLSQFIQTGGTVIVCADGVWINNSLETSEPQHNLFSFLDEYGIKLEKNLVLSTSSLLVNFGSETMQFPTRYYLWPVTNTFSKNTSYFSNISQLTFPWASSLTINSKKGVTSVVQTANNSWTQQNTFILNPQEIIVPEKKSLKPYIVIGEAKKGKGSLLVVSNSRFMNDQFITQMPLNGEFILNVVNQHASNGALSGIRSRASTSYPIRELTEVQRDLFKYGTILTLPLLFSIFGFILFIKRKRS